MKLTFQAVNETDGEVSPATPPLWENSPLSPGVTKRLAEDGITVPSELAQHKRWASFLPPGDFLVWMSQAPYVAANVGLYTVAIDFDGPDGQSKFYLDPLLRIDPP